MFPQIKQFAGKVADRWEDYNNSRNEGLVDPWNDTDPDIAEQRSQKRWETKQAKKAAKKNPPQA
jgi:hypothetical protein